MATNLQVNASTQQAVGAFNALAASIAAARTQFQGLGTTLQSGTATVNRYGQSIIAINSAFSSLTSMVSGAFSAIRALGAGTIFAFRSIIKELDKLQGFNAIMSVTTKSADAVTASYDFLRKTADRLGVQFDALTGNYAKLVASLPPGIKGLQTAEKVFMGTAMAARTLHSTNQDTQLMFYALTQMASKGVVSMEELRRQLGEKLPGVMQIAARALNTLPETLEAAIRKGIVSSEKFLPIFGDALIRTFADSSEKASISVSAAIARLSNVWVDFVKRVLDSGAGDSIVGVFDALREKLSDPYLIERFAILIKTLSERVTEFVRNISADDLRNGFDVATKAIEMTVNIIGKLIEGMTWVINNSAKAGAVVGAMGGAALGAVVAGPYGAAAGFVAGGAAGAYAGAQLRPTTEQQQSRAAADAAGEAARAAKAREAELFKFTALIPMLQNFKGLNSFNGLEKLFQAENLNTKTLVDLNRILTGPEFKGDKDRAQGVRDYAKFGTVVGPQTNTLNDVLGAGKPKVDKSLGASEMKAYGLNPNIQKELGNYLTLLKSGKLTTDQYADALQNLIAKQPYMIEYQRALRKEQAGDNKATSEHIDYILKEIKARDDLAARVDEEIRMSTLHGEALQIESQVQAEINRRVEAQLTILPEEIRLLREKYKLISDNKAVASIEGQILGATLDKDRPKIDTFKALDNLKAKEPGFGKAQAQDFLVRQNPTMFQGTQEAMEVQKRATQDFYAFVDKLRKEDYISEATAAQMKARANAEGQAQQLTNASSFFGNLTALQKSGSKKLFAVGKAAAIAQALVDGYAAVQKAYASVPYPYNILAAGATAVSVYANVQQIRSTQAGFMDGGYTGNGPRGQNAGVVHGQEFVVNSAATARNRAVLEAINAGRDVQSTGGGRVPVTVIVNAPPGSAVEQQQRDTPSGTEIEVTIKRVVVDDVRRGGPISTNLERQYGLNRALGAVR